MRVKVPSGLWPSFWVMVIAGAMVSLVCLVGLLIANVYAEGSSYVPTFRVPLFTESVIEAHMDYALNSNEYNDVIFLGASAALTGIVTNSFEEATGLRAYNLGNVVVIGPDGHLEIFRAYLKGHPKPELLVYTVYPRDLGYESSTDAHVRDRFVQAYGQVLQAREARPVQDPTFFFSVGFWRLQELVKNGTTHPFDVPRGLLPPHREVAQLLAESRGYQQYPQGYVLDLEYLDDIRGVPVSDWYDASFREMAELARHNDIGLMVWIMPIPVPINPVGDDLVTAWANEFMSAFPEVRIEGLPLQQYDLDLWANASHLNRSGAELFTSTVRDKVVEFLVRQERG